jgi:hypothetical protein
MIGDARLTKLLRIIALKWPKQFYAPVFDCSATSDLMVINMSKRTIQRLCKVIGEYNFWFGVDAIVVFDNPANMPQIDMIVLACIGHPNRFDRTKGQQIIIEMLTDMLRNLRQREKVHFECSFLYDRTPRYIKWRKPWSRQP